MFLFRRKPKPTPPTKTKTFRKDIQALRALAVTAVVLYHLWPNRMTGGFAGVDIFFVISGYLMTISILRRLNPLTDKHNVTPRTVFKLLADFYAHRIRRLVPAALTALLGVLTLAWISGNLNVLLTNAKNVISAATFWQNWYLAKDSLNYLQQDNLVVASQHFWSLSLEEQFYLAWPLFLIIASLITINIVVLFKKQKIPGIILPITLATLVSLVYGVWLTHTDQTVAYYSTPARVWELMLGGIIALLPLVKNYDLKLLLPYGGLVICLYSLFFIDANNFPGWWAVLPTIGTAMIILGGDGKPASPLAFERAFRWRPIQWLGNISYSFYLWHFPLIILLPIIIHHDINGPHGTLFKIGIIVASLIISHLSYLFIEQPTQKLRFKLRYIYILFAVATALVVGLAFLAKHHTEGQLDKNLKDMHSAVLNMNDQCIGARAILHQDACGNPYGKTNAKFMSVGRQDDWSKQLFNKNKLCYTFDPTLKSRNDPNKYCVLGDKRAKQSFVVLGDSHTDQYVNAFDYIGKKYHYRVIMLGSSFCGAWGDDNTSKLCDERLDFMTKSGILNSRSFIVMSFLFRDYDSVSHFVNTIKSSIDSRVVLFQDEPHSTVKRISNCYTMRVDCNMPRDKSASKSHNIINKLIENKEISKKNVVMTDDMFCSGNKCYSSIGGIPVYFNTVYNNEAKYNSHITASYALTLAPILEQKLLSHDLLK